MGNAYSLFLVVIAQKPRIHGHRSANDEF